MLIKVVLFHIFIYMIESITNGNEEEEFCRINDCNVPESPNIVILLADDLGYGDLNCYGHPSQEWNDIDRMASEGLKFTQFYAGDSMCTPSRAALLTGRLPIRLGMTGGKRVLMHSDRGGLPASEITIAEMLRDRGYYTGMTGKWHLGINALNSSDGTHLPHNHGFDYVGLNLPFSNLWECDTTGFFAKKGPNEKKCFLYRGRDIIEQPIKSFGNLTENLVADWKQFVEKWQKMDDRPFFFYFSFPHVHSAQFAAANFRGRSNRGLYGDNLNEMAWAVGQVLDSLRLAGIAETSLVLFLSDHGPHRELCLYGGSTAGLKGGKSNSYEGGFRIPFIAWMPGQIPAGLTSTTVMSSLDLFPTFSQLSKKNKQNDFNKETYDGIAVADYLFGRRFDDNTSQIARSRPIFFYCNKHLMAVRYGQFKVHYRTSPYYSREQMSVDCIEGSPKSDWYVSQTCPEKDLIDHKPPLIYHIHYDPYELYPLKNDDNSIRQLLNEVETVVSRHMKSIRKVPPQLGDFDPAVIPCCDYPKCNCS